MFSYQLSGEVSGIRYQVSGIRYQVSGINRQNKAPKSILDFANTKETLDVTKKNFTHDQQILFL